VEELAQRLKPTTVLRVMPTMLRVMLTMLTMRETLLPRSGTWILQRGPCPC
jgi:hypothetical protein